MVTRKLTEGSRLVGATSWAAIAFGVFTALALQHLLIMFGLALGVSTGDRNVAGGFALWVVIVQLLSIALGAALAARLAHAGNRTGGVAAGVMTWAVALVLGGTLQGVSLMEIGPTGAWAAFFAALLGLAAAIAGGAAGSSIGRPTAGPVTQEPIIAGT
jgi:hypothetical protein